MQSSGAAMGDPCSKQRQSFLDAFRARREALHPSPDPAISAKKSASSTIQAAVRDSSIRWDRFAHLRIMVGSGSYDTLGLGKTYYYHPGSSVPRHSSVENDIPLIDGPCIRIRHNDRGKCIVLPELESDSNGVITMRTKRGSTRISTTTPDLSDAQVNWLADNSCRGAHVNSSVSVFVPIDAFSPLFEIVGSMWKAESGGARSLSSRTAVVAWRPASSPGARWPTLAGMVANGIPGVLQPLAQVGISNACIPFYQSRECIVDISVDFSSCDLSRIISAACFHAAVSASSISILARHTKKKAKRSTDGAAGHEGGDSMSMLSMQRALIRGLRRKKGRRSSDDSESDSSSSSCDSDSSCDFADNVDFWTSEKCKPIPRPQKCVVGGVVAPSLFAKPSDSQQSDKPAAEPLPGEKKRRKRKVSSSSSLSKRSVPFYEWRSAMFENVCGSAVVHGFTVSSASRHHQNIASSSSSPDQQLRRCWTTCSSSSPPPHNDACMMMMPSSSPSSSSSSSNHFFRHNNNNHTSPCAESSASGAPLVHASQTTSAAQRRTTNRFGECYVVPSIEGNIYLRDISQSTLVTFKVPLHVFIRCTICLFMLTQPFACVQGARNVEMVRETVDAVLKRKTVLIAQGYGGSGRIASLLEEREDYRVYMAVASACIGRHIVVGGYNVMSRTLEKVLRRMGGTVETIFQLEEEGNAERLKVLGWGALWACAIEIDASFRSPKWGAAGLDLSIEMAPPESWQNNISITSKGCIITRLSWGDPIVWTEETSRMALNACNVLAYVIQHCC